MRRLAFSLHRWLGLLFALLWLTVALSGTLLVFKEELDALRFLSRVGPCEKSVALEEALGVALARHPLGSGSFTLRLPRSPFEPLRIQFLTADILAEVVEPVVLWIDTCDGELLSEEPLSRLPVEGWLYRIHARFGLGDGAKPLVALSGIGLALQVLLGAAIAWRAGLRFRRPNLAALHRLTGLPALPLLLFSILTGLYLALPRHWLPWLYPEERPREVPTVLPLPERLPLSRLLQLGSRCLPSCRPRQLFLPTSPEEAVRLDFACPGKPDTERGWTRLWLDPYRGEVVALERPVARGVRGWLARFGYDLHNGSLFGPLGRGAVVLSGLALALLSGTGLLRRLKKGRKRA